MTSVCSMPEIMEVMFIINKIIGILKILIPIIIVITGMSSLFKAVLESDDKQIRDSIDTFIVKIFVGAAIFFIPTIVNNVISLVAPDSSYTLCFIVTDKEDIYKSYAASANEYINKTRKSLDKDDYENAAYYVSKMQDGSTKKSYENKLKDLDELITAKRKQNNSSNGGSNSNSQSKPSSAYGDIFVGDSRTVGYSYQLSLRSSDVIYATNVGAMAAFQSDFSKALSKINSDTSHRYNLVLNYGVNNMSQDWVSAYQNAINQVGGKANILIVSVNPCNDNIARYCRNSNIVNLNNKLQSAFSSGYSNVKYCDTYTPFVSTPNYTSMIETDEGIHYTLQGSTLIYNKIQACLKSF